MQSSSLKGNKVVRSHNSNNESHRHQSKATMISSKNKAGITAAVLVAMALVTTLVVDQDLKGLRNGFDDNEGISRRMSINLGGGDCIWTAPNRSPPEDVVFEKTLLAGFPSGDKRMIWVQMESLAGLPAQNDWDRFHNGATNSPFIKTNYPHTAGTWSWNEGAARVALAVQYIRRSMVEYGDIMSYIDAPAAYGDKKNSLESQYGKRNNFNAFYEWRDTHVLSEIYWYGWVIDYWMEGGVMRDPYSHSKIDTDYWTKFQKPEAVNGKKDKCQVCHRTKSPKNPWISLEVSCNALAAHMAHGDYNGTCDDASQESSFTDVEIGETSFVHDHEPQVDSNCQKVKRGCVPDIIISTDKLRDYTEGPLETARIGEFLLTNQGVADYVIDREAWPCIWNKLLVEKVGPATFQDRDLSDDPNFSPFMLGEMIYELDRMIKKYSTGFWDGNDKAERLVSLFSEHKVLLQTEYDDVVSGRRTLRTGDIFGPHEKRPTN